jgi:predicted NUDIX family NTP pyrophosphohydrolase
MAKLSAGVLMYRRGRRGVELLLVHPGGPFWANKDEGAWSIPKGEYDEGEDALAAAKREFAEELGSAPPSRPFLDLGAIKQASRKQVAAFAVEGDFDPATLRSNLFEIEWPPRSGRKRAFPEIDRAAWLLPSEARAKIQPGQAPFIDRLLEALGLAGLGVEGSGRR